MRRRDLIALICAAGWPLPARAQQSRMYRIGALVIGLADVASFQKELREGLSELGRVEGRDYVVELRSADGELGRLPTLAAELVRLKVDVIVALFTPCGLAAKEATREIPIVVLTGDPLGTGLVRSLTRPGANVTGLSQMAHQTHLKCVELFQDMLPGARRIGLLVNGADPLFAKSLLEEARVVGITPVTVVQRADELEATFAKLATETDAVVFQASFPSVHMAELGLKYRLPTATALRAYAEIGGFMAYQADTRLLFRRAAIFVHKILRGESPADMPVEQPTKFGLVINLRTARTIGVSVPESFLLRADEVIE
jgi:putative tryptophan/tyrosine transport system substrate-binding protein